MKPLRADGTLYRRGTTYCAHPNCPGPRACQACHRIYMRVWRRLRPSVLTEEDRIRARARAAIKMRIRRGTYKRGPCVDCGGVATECHHEDYSKPFDVIDLCGKCHRKRHR